MSKVDWSLAPEGATHWTPADVCNPFIKLDGDKWFWFNEGWISYGENDSWKAYQLDGVIERPKQPQAWSGPEDGLPPVGTVCEARILLPGQSNYLWRRCEVVYRNDEMSQSELLVVDIEKTTARWADEFRAIKTEEDIASDKRESAIRELMDIAQVDCRVTAARLVDAGFKREGK